MTRHTEWHVTLQDNPINYKSVVQKGNTRIIIIIIIIIKFTQGNVANNLSC